MIDNSEASFQDLFTFRSGLVWVPFVCDDSQTEMLGESCNNVVFSDVISEHIDTCEMGLSIFDSSNDEIIIIRVLIVSFLIANSSQIVGVVFDGEGDVIVENFSLTSHFVHLSGYLLKIRVLSGSSHHDILCNFLVSANIGVFCD